MNRDLESLVLAFEAWRSASHIEAKKFQDIYEDKIQDVADSLSRTIRYHIDQVG